MANRVRDRVPCPSCEDLITFVDRPKVDGKIRCPHCGVDLIIVEIDPIELDWDDEKRRNPE